MTRVRLGHNSGAGFIEDDSLSVSAQGYEFQFKLTKAILDRLRGFSTVTLRTMDGSVITHENYRRMGADGGLDLVVEVAAKTEAAARAVHTRVRAAILGIELD